MFQSEDFPHDDSVERQLRWVRSPIRHVVSDHAKFVSKNPEIDLIFIAEEGTSDHSDLRWR